MAPASSQQPGTSGGFSSCCTLVLIEIFETLACFRQALQQGSRFPQFAVLLMKFADPVIDFFEADGICIPHGPTPVTGEAISIEVDDVDINGAQRIAFLEDARPLVDQRVNA